MLHISQHLWLSRKAACFYWPHCRRSFFFVFFKTLLDPFYVYLYLHSPINEGDRVVDLGAGRSIFVAWCAALDERFKSGIWPAYLSRPKKIHSYYAVESNQNYSKAATPLLNSCGYSGASDIVTGFWGIADLVLMIDVMQYIPKNLHKLVLVKIHSSLSAQGTLLLRVGDKNGGTRHLITSVADRVDAAFKMVDKDKIGNSRSIKEWGIMLKSVGYSFDFIPMNKGTPFSNILIVAKKNS